MQNCIEIHIHIGNKILYIRRIYTLLVAQLAWSISVCAIPNKYCALFSPTLISHAINLVLHSFLWINIRKKMARIENLMSSTESIWYRERKKNQWNIFVISNTIFCWSKSREKKDVMKSSMKEVTFELCEQIVAKFFFYLSELNTFTCPVCWQAIERDTT